MSFCRQIWNTQLGIWMDATENRSANQAVKFDVEARQEITLKVTPIKEGIARSVLLGSSPID